MRVTVIFDEDGTLGLGLALIEAEEMVDAYLSGGGHPGRVVSRMVELEPEDEKSTSTDETEDTLPGRLARPGMRVVDGGCTETGSPRRSSPLNI